MATPHVCLFKSSEEKSGVADPPHLCFFRGSEEQSGFCLDNRGLAFLREQTNCSPILVSNWQSRQTRGGTGPSPDNSQWEPNSGDPMATEFN